MKRIRLTLMYVVILMVFFMPINAFAEDIDGKVILIDAGHGGFDGGAKSNSGVIEKDINLQISLKLKEVLESKGYKIYLTRDIDKGLEEKGSTIREKKREDLKKRRDMKSEINCDIFISIHQNMFPQAKCFGAQVWYSDNEVSKKLAESVQESIKEVVKDDNKRVSKPAGDAYLILRDNYEGASILIECGFLSNPEEEKKLQTEEHQNLIVEGISLGIDRYFETNNKLLNEENNKISN